MLVAPNMKQVALPSYDELNQLLLKTEFKFNPSQLHGLACGLLCGKQLTEKTWEDLIKSFFPQVEKTNAQETASHLLFKNLYEITKLQLEDYLFEFDLVLPDDEQKLELRAEALTLWCQGFLTGLKLAEIPIEGHKQAEVKEAIGDLVEIAKMNYENVVDSDEDEAAYIELVEFVRMAIILVYQNEKEMMTANQVNSNQSLH